MPHRLMSTLTIVALAATGLTSPAPATAAAAPTFEVAQLAGDRGISLAEAARRLDRQQLAPDLAERAERALGAQFGGVWIDVADGDRIKVGVVSTAALAAAHSLVAAIGLTGDADVVTVRHSMARLQAGNDWLGTRIAKANTDAAWPLSAGLRPDINAIELQVPPGGELTPRQRALVAEAKRELGSALVIATSEAKPAPLACDYPYCDPPLRAGIRIHNSGKGCTGGFIAESTVDGKLYQFTAGHCAQNYTDNWSTKFTDGSRHVIGPVHRWYWWTQGDMAIMRITNVPGWNPQGWVHVTSGPDTTTDEDYYLKGSRLSIVGMRICSTGAYYGRSDCGEVTHTGVTLTYGGVTVHHLGKSNGCGKPGDSGAPMYSFHWAFGLLVAGPEAGGCGIYYQGMRAAEDRMNVRIYSLFS